MSPRAKRICREIFEDTVIWTAGLTAFWLIGGLLELAPMTGADKEVLHQLHFNGLYFGLLFMTTQLLVRLFLLATETIKEGTDVH